MITEIHFLNSLMPLLYLSTVIVYFYDLIFEGSKFYNSKRVFLFITVFIHIIYLSLRIIKFQHAPITNKFEILTLISLCLSISYFILELLTDFSRTGLLPIIFSFLFQLISSIFISDQINIPAILSSTVLGAHVIGSVLGYSSITIATIYSIVYLLQYYNLKNNKFSLIYRKMPNLEVLEKLIYNSFVIAFIFHSISIIVGLRYAYTGLPNFQIFDPKFIISMMIWFIFIVGISLKIFKKLFGKGIIKIVLIIFCLILISLFIPNNFINSFHIFY